MTDEQVIRLQADRFNVALGVPLGTFIPVEQIKAILDAPLNKVTIINDREVMITMSIKGLASILLKKIE